MDSEAIAEIIRQNIPGAQVQVIDTTGTRDHFEAEVVAEAFRGKTLLQQHRMVQAPLQPFIQDGRIHALALKTRTP